MSAGEILHEAKAVRDQAEQLYSAAEVRAAVGVVAGQVSGTLADSNPIVLAVMSGGAFFAAELCRQLDFPYEFDYVHASRYRRELQGGRLDWHLRPAVQLRDRVVLVVDDVLDRGTTLAALHEELGRLPVAATYTAVLVEKAVERPQHRPRIDFCALHAGDAYLFGCGMDYKGYWRGLPALYAVRER